MAGAKVTITVDDREVQALFARLTAFGRNPMHEVGHALGETVLRSTRERAARQVDPSGIPWRPLSEEYAKHKARKRPGVPILKFDFHMLGDQLDYQVHDDFVELGTNAVYGAIHQFGGKTGRGHKATMPSRPFLGVSDEDRERFGEILRDALDDALDGR